MRFHTDSNQFQYLPVQDSHTPSTVHNFASGDSLDGGVLPNPVEQIFKSFSTPERGRRKVNSAENEKNRTIEADRRSKLQLQKERNLEIQKQFVKKIKSPKGLVGSLYTCLKCEKTFKKSIRACAHALKCGDKTSLTKKRQKSQRKLSCNICGHIEHTKKALTQHRLVHHKAHLKWHRCSRCPPTAKYFLSVASYRRHVARHVSPVVFTCTFNFCGKKFATKANVERHRRMVHLKESSASPATSSSPTSTSTTSSEVVASSPLLVSSTRESELAPIEQIRNSNIRGNGTEYLQLCARFGDSDEAMSSTTRILEGRLVLPKSPSQSRLASKAALLLSKNGPPSSSRPSSMASMHSPSLPPAGSAKSSSSQYQPASPTSSTFINLSHPISETERLDFEAPIMTNKATQTEETKGKYDCTICDYKGRDNYNLSTHNKKVHQQRQGG